MNASACRRRLRSELSYSVRRFYVDSFFLRHVRIFSGRARLLDMGGYKHRKRGLFDLSRYGLDVTYTNLAMDREPDVLCDIGCLPIAGEVFDGVVLSEVLEHVPAPRTVLAEAYRVLKPGGVGLVCTPFMFHVHADPFDFGRYTDHYYRTTLGQIGFTRVHIEKQGLLFSVLANTLKLYVLEAARRQIPRSAIARRLLKEAALRFAAKAPDWDRHHPLADSPAFSGHTTGYGIVCRK